MIFSFTMAKIRIFGYYSLRLASNQSLIGINIVVIIDLTQEISLILKLPI